jgi:hypothetical protein
MPWRGAHTVHMKPHLTHANALENALDPPVIHGQKMGAGMRMLYDIPQAPKTRKHGPQLQVPAECTVRIRVEG